MLTETNIIENPYTKEELNVAKEAFYSNLDAPMASQTLFERLLKEVVGSEYVLSCQSGTAALHLSLVGIGIADGDEVFCPSFTYASVPNAIIYCGGKPTFIDNEPDEFHISIPLILEEIAERKSKGSCLPKAIVYVHSYGWPRDLTGLQEVCKSNNIVLIEDSAGALGSCINDNHVGNVGACGIISFNLNKIISTGGGGAFITNDKNLYRKVRKLSNNGKNSHSRYKFDLVGFNYIMHPFAAELGSIKLNSLGAILNKRKEGFERVCTKTHINYQKLMCCDNTEPNHWRIPFLLELQPTNFQVEELWLPLHTQEPYKEFKFIGKGNINLLGKEYGIIKNII